MYGERPRITSGASLSHRYRLVHALLERNGPENTPHMAVGVIVHVSPALELNVLVAIYQGCIHCALREETTRTCLVFRKSANAL